MQIMGLDHIYRYTWPKSIELINSEYTVIVTYICLVYIHEPRIRT